MKTNNNDYVSGANGVFRNAKGGPMKIGTLREVTEEGKFMDQDGVLFDIFTEATTEQINKFFDYLDNKL